MARTTENDLKKMNKADLLALLVRQSRELDRTKADLEIARKKLENRQIILANAGSIAEASLALNQIFEDAQKAADMYLENIYRMYPNPGYQAAMPGQEMAGMPQENAGDQTNHDLKNAGDQSNRDLKNAGDQPKADLENIGDQSNGGSGNIGDQPKTDPRVTAEGGDHV